MKKSKKTALIALIILITLILAVCIFAFIFEKSSEKQKTDQVSDYNPLSWIKPSGNSRDSEKKNTIDKDAKGKIVIPGFSKQTIVYGDGKSMTFSNPKANDVNFVYTVFFRDREIYKSGVISPGKSVKWNPHEIFKNEGEYQIRIILQPFDSANTEKNGISQTVNIKIEN